jgi:hypothetical protein
MKVTYGQQVDGKRITLIEFGNQVNDKCSQVGIDPSIRAIKSLYNKGYSVEDAVSYLIMKS